MAMQKREQIERKAIEGEQIMNHIVLDVTGVALPEGEKAPHYEFESPAVIIASIHDEGSRVVISGAFSESMVANLVGDIINSAVEACAPHLLRLFEMKIERRLARAIAAKRMGMSMPGPIDDDDLVDDYLKDDISDSGNDNDGIPSFEEFLKGLGSHAHDCNNCPSKGKCPIEDDVRASKAKEDAEAAIGKGMDMDVEAFFKDLFREDPSLGTTAEIDMDAAPGIAEMIDQKAEEHTSRQSLK